MDFLDPSQRAPLITLIGLVVLLVAAYWDMFTLTSAAWSEDLYSHGWIVPLFAVGLLWLRWKPIQSVPSSERWLGLLILGFGLAMRLVAAEYTILPLDRLSFIPSIFGAFMLVGGLQTIRWAWPGLIFLVFMFPLPNVLETSVLNRLQHVATISSTFVLQTLGVAAFREGNLISIPGMGQPLNVAEACAGLRMATIFGALAVAMVFIIERPWWDKFVILLSAIPIALIVNIVRITVTALLSMMVGQDNYAVQKICHDYAGYVIMMPLALALLWIELQILERVTVPVDTVQLRPVGGARGVASIPTR
ncbi:MAG TPA: exosortase/archaeosortase family protein [Lacipirellulaceae bacterium]|nr:exosortase/archaeosortase family protein [Lacipirellulaceae bacterium]